MTDDWALSIDRSDYRIWAFWVSIHSIRKVKSKNKKKEKKKSGNAGVPPFFMIGLD
jgi:hypothetical protein